MNSNPHKKNLKDSIPYLWFHYAFGYRMVLSNKLATHFLGILTYISYAEQDSMCYKGLHSAHHQLHSFIVHSFSAWYLSAQTKNLECFMSSKWKTLSCQQKGFFLKDVKNISKFKSNPYMYMPPISNYCGITLAGQVFAWAVEVDWFTDCKKWMKQHKHTIMYTALPNSVTSLLLNRRDHTNTANGKT